MNIRATAGANSGTRPINFNRDIAQIMPLLETAFGKKATGGIPKHLQHTPPFLHRFDPVASKMGTGIVWEENGRIVGNASIMKSDVDGRYLVVNVAVHPDWRRRGIARGMMDAAIETVRRQGGSEIMLQVDKGNAAATDLYQRMHFETLGGITNWEVAGSRLRTLPSAQNGERMPLIRPLRGNEWKEAWNLDQLSVSPDLDWPEPIPDGLYKVGIFSRFFYFVNGRYVESWTISLQSGRLVGLAGIWGDWGRPYRARIRVHPDWRGQLERPLCAKIIARLSRLSGRKMYIEHPNNDDEVAALLKEANFTPRRTLVHMKLAINN